MDLLLNTEKERLSSTSAVAQDYVSMFKIDGLPILPPLMTIERRYEMQMYREKALQLEKKFCKKVKFNSTEQVDTPRSLPDYSYSESASRASQRSSELESDISSNQNSHRCTAIKVDKSSETVGTGDVQPKVLVDCGTTTKTSIAMTSINERLQKLSKSETIVFDNTLNTIIKAMTDLEVAEASEQQEQRLKNKKCSDDTTTTIDIRQMEENANLNHMQPKKLLHLPLQQKATPSATSLIPSICVNPPTPLGGPGNICDTLSGSESVDSFDISGFQSSQATQRQIADIPEDTSSDDSANTHSIVLATPHKTVNGIMGKMLQFEETQNDVSMQLRTPQRSATSPSLKSLTDTMGTASLTPSPRDEEDTTSHSLVRSSSFTLDGPSEVLLDHIRQQSAKKAKSNNVSPTPAPGQTRHSSCKRRDPPSPSAWRDTVESKAKRVQKKIDFKASSRGSSNGRAKSKSFNHYTSSTAPLWNKPLPPLKVKHSPYDAKPATSTTSSATGKPQSKTGAGYKHHTHSAGGKHQKQSAVKKSISSTTYTVNESGSRDFLPAQGSARSTGDSSSCNAVMNEIEHRHRQKLLSLIAQQQAEQRNLQQAFELQQKMLLEQLGSEMYRVQLDGSQQAAQLPQLPSPPLITAQSPLLGTPKATLLIEGVALRPPSSSHFQNSPTLEVTNSYISPALCGAIGGFTTTTTLSPCELPLDVSNGSAAHAETAILPPSHNATRLLQLVGGLENGTSTSHSIGIATTMVAADNTTDGPSGVRRDSPFWLKFGSQSERREAATTIICAYARGYLVRRLFQTEQIQRIVQTIRDTLIFVLNLHIETIENADEANTPANIKLKARLLQQLASASRTLHLIFFQTSIKERMDIIARDRKRIKMKLLTMNMKSSPRVDNMNANEKKRKINVMKQNAV